MIQIAQKTDCCGCEACVQRCPKQCISLKEDEEGFLYPIVNKDECIDCGLCEKVCPVINQNERHNPIKVLAAKNKDENIRLKSSSGGIFTLLAESILDENGIVFGACFNDKWEVTHGYTETKEGLSAFRGAKYVQSKIGDSYKQAEVFLKQNRKVLFSGTPCQIAGLKRYLRKEYDNLFTVDVICHGVPSPKVWRLYLDKILNLKDGQHSASSHSADKKTRIGGINFRSKSTGWKEYSFEVTLSRTTDGRKNTIVHSDVFKDNIFMKAFLSDLILRPSCHLCPAKAGKSGSDISIADYWSIQDVAPEFDDDKGVSLVLIQTEKGNMLYQTLQNKSEWIETGYEESTKHNGGFKEVCKPHPKRADFFRELNSPETELYDIEVLVKNTLKRTDVQKIKHLIKRTIRWIAEK